MTTTEQSPELSIVMPAYNEAANIASVLESTTRHMERSGIRYEINVVDDGSDDGTGRLLEKMAQRQPRLRICLLYTSPSPRDATLSRMPSSA